MVAIEAEALTRRFGRRIAVDAISLRVPDAAVYGFLGPNGAGKTTTLKMLLGLLKPTAGVARIAGLDVASDRIAAARPTGALLEAHGFYANLTGRENLDLTRSLLGLARAEVDRVLEVVDMAADAARRVGGYSLGMRQRLGLARAMLGSPPVLILDEPTNGLDPDGIADMRGFLKTLPERTGATVLLSSHLLGEIEQTATHVGILSEGRLVLEGELARLKADLAPEIGLRVDDVARARTALVGHDLTIAEQPEGLTLRLRPGQDHDAVTARINRDLVEAGVAVFALRPHARSLEGIYRAVTTAPKAEAKEIA